MGCNASNPPPMKTHKCHLATHPEYPQRSPVTHISWEEDEPNYAPIEFTHERVIRNDHTKKPTGWADPVEYAKDLEHVIAARVSYALQINGRVPMVNGRPRNPVGRTGMIGRGLLGKYGANQAADCLVTRNHPENGQLQMVAIKRKDTGQWAIPGGFVNNGEKFHLTAKREFLEETRNGSYDSEQEKAVSEKLDKLLRSRARIVYAGYVDDPRNTDWAWMETHVMYYHITDEFLSKNLTFQAGDDAADAKWINISKDDPDFANLYASHREMIEQAVL